jgi:hypothetical protein
MSQFFGNLSPFEIFVSAVAIMTGLYTLYKSFIERAKLSLHPGDRIGLDIRPGQSCHNFLLGCTLANGSTKMATLHRLEADVCGPKGLIAPFVWHQFADYAQGGRILQRTADPHPVSIPPKDSLLKFIEFQTDSKPESAWPSGTYEFIIRGWVNRGSRREQPNLLSRFHIRIDDDLSSRLSNAAHKDHSVIHVIISEWQRTS